MDIIIAIPFLIVGFLLGNWGISQILTVIRFGIPYTNELRISGFIENSHLIIRKQIKVMIVWIIIVASSIIAVYILFSLLDIIVYLVGLSYGTVNVFRFTGKTEPNILAYLRIYENFFIDDDIKE